MSSCAKAGAARAVKAAVIAAKITVFIMSSYHVITYPVATGGITLHLWKNISERAIYTPSNISPWIMEISFFQFQSASDRCGMPYVDSQAVRSMNEKRLGSGLMRRSDSCAGWSVLQPPFVRRFTPGVAASINRTTLDRRGLSEDGALPWQTKRRERRHSLEGQAAPAFDPPLALVQCIVSLCTFSPVASASSMRIPPLLGTARRQFRPALAAEGALRQLADAPGSNMTSPCRGAGIRVSRSSSLSRCSVTCSGASSIGTSSAELAFRKGELNPRHVWQDIKDHARLRFPTGVAATRYNVLQKASYIGVIFVRCCRSSF